MFNGITVAAESSFFYWGDLTLLQSRRIYLTGYITDISHYK